MTGFLLGGGTSLLRRRAMAAKKAEKEKMKWEVGALSIWGGIEQESTKHIRTSGFYRMDAGTYRIAGDTLNKFCYFQYDDSRSAPVKYGGYLDKINVVYSASGYLRLMMNTSDLTRAEKITIEKIS